MHIYAQAIHTHTHTPFPHLTPTHAHTQTHTTTHPTTHGHIDPHTRIRTNPSTYTGRHTYTHTEPPSPKHLTVTHPLSRYVSLMVCGLGGGVHDCLFGSACGRAPVCVGGGEDVRSTKPHIRTSHTHAHTHAHIQTHPSRTTQQHARAHKHTVRFSCNLYFRFFCLKT